MAQQIKRFKVYVAAPRGLEEEARLAREAIRTFSDTLARPRGLEFVATGGARTPGGSPTPRRMVLEDIRLADFFILLLHDRWRSRGSDGPGVEDAEDFQEQYELAVECLEDPASAVRGVAVLLKAVPRGAKATASFQLKQVLDFRKYLESHGSHDYAEFDDTSELTDSVRSFLTGWVNRLDALKAPVSTPDDQPDDVYRLAMEESGVMPSNRADLIGEAKRLADAGRHAGAEACFAMAIARADDPGALVEYAKFLRRVGRLTAAEEMLQKAVTFAENSRNDSVLAAALAQLGLILQVRGDLPGAEKMLRRCLTLGKKLKDQKRQASTLGSIGLLFKARGDLPKAELMMRKALAIEEKLGRLSGMANQYCNLGLISRRVGDLTRAEMLLRRALAIDEKLGRLEAVANQYTNIGLILRAKGKTDEAETMIRKALAINETLGRLEGLASDYANLGVIFESRGQLDEAERLHLTSLAMEEQVGRREGVARSHRSLGGIAVRRGDGKAAARHWTTAHQIFADIGMISDAREARGLVMGLRKGDPPLTGGNGKR